MCGGLPEGGGAGRRVFNGGQIRLKPCRGFSSRSNRARPDEMKGVVPIPVKCGSHVATPNTTPLSFLALPKTAKYVRFAKGSNSRAQEFSLILWSGAHHRPQRAKTMEYLEQAKNEIQIWETEKPGFLNQAADFLLWPAEKAAEALIPKSVQEAVGNAIQSCLSAISSQTTRTFDAGAIGQGISARIRELGGDTPTLCHQLQASDERGREFWKWHIGYAAVEGGATGAAGLLGLAADIPALFSILVREMQEIATCYGYDVSTEREREYLLQVLRAGFASNVKVKMEFIVTLKEFEQILVNVAWKKMAEEFAAKQFSKHSILAGLRQFAKSLGFQLTKRKALQMIPVIGAIVGASLNGTLANDIGKAAYMSYRRRWISERGGGGDSTLTLL